MHSSCLVLIVLFALGMFKTSNSLTDPPQTDWPPRELIDPFLDATVPCRKETGITEDHVRKFSNTPQMFDDNKSFKCYIYCVYERNGFILPNGKLDKAGLLKTIEPLAPEAQLILLNMGKTCLAQKEKDPCERLYGVVKCMKLNDPVHFYII